MPQQRFYTGYSGQMAVVAELTFRRCNAAVPALDEGTDVFAFRQERPEVARLQVKASKGTPLAGRGYSTQFKIPMRVMQSVDDPPLFYVLAVRFNQSWPDFLVIGRARLRDYWVTRAGFGTLDRTQENLFLKVQFRPTTVTCSGADLQRHRNAWHDLLPLQVPVAVPPVPPPPPDGSSARTPPAPPVT